MTVDENRRFAKRALSRPVRERKRLLQSQEAVPDCQESATAMKLISLLLLVCVLSTADDLGAQRPDLSGVVLTVASKALPNATVFIYTAGPKVGVGTL